MRWWRSATSFFLAVGFCAGLDCSDAKAHQLPLGVGVVTVQGSRVGLELTFPVSAFPEVRPERHVSPASFERDKDLYASRLARKFGVATSTDSGTEVPAQWVKTELVLVPADPSAVDGTFNLQVTALLELPHSAERILFKSLVWEPGAESQTLKLDVMQRQESFPPTYDVLLLSPERPTAEAFVPWNLRLSRSIVLGLEHILLGADHLVFLLTVLISRIGIRRWAILLTAFSISHAITFALATLGWVAMSAALVEAAIAASITLMAALELRKVQVSIWLESIVILVLGLIHGLGFASAIGMNHSFANDLLSAPILTIIGFNIGIEFGQVLFAMGMLLSYWVISNLTQAQYAVLIRKYALLACAGLGLFWLVERAL